MQVYIGLDVSLASTAICVLGEKGNIVTEVQVASAPDSLVSFLRELPHGIAAIGLEAGPLSNWLHKGLTDAGFETVLMETRQVKAALKAMPIKTDRRDAEGIARLLQMGWFRPVHCKTVSSQEIRAGLPPTSPTWGAGATAMSRWSWITSARSPMRWTSSARPSRKSSRAARRQRLDDAVGSGSQFERTFERHLTFRYGQRGLRQTTPAGAPAWPRRSPAMCRSRTCEECSPGPGHRPCFESASPGLAEPVPLPVSVGFRLWGWGILQCRFAGRHARRLAPLRHHLRRCTR